jgi:hypothetical protein
MNDLICVADVCEDHLTFVIDIDDIKPTCCCTFLLVAAAVVEIIILNLLHFM